MAQSGKKRVAIALQKPTVILGNADPMASIYRHLQRSYTYGPVKARWIVGSVIAACGVGVACFWASTWLFCTPPPIFFFRCAGSNSLLLLSKTSPHSVPRVAEGHRGVSHPIWKQLGHFRVRALGLRSICGDPFRFCSRLSSVLCP